MSEHPKDKYMGFLGEAAFEDPSLPNVKPAYLEKMDLTALHVEANGEKPKFLVLTGSLRTWSFSRMLAEEVARLLIHMGGEVKFFDPRYLPMPTEGYQLGGESAHNVQIKQLIDLSLWADGHVWVSPERHGNMTAVLKNQIDHLPLEIGSVRPTQGRTLALLQVAGGSQSFNTVNNMRILGRWMRMLVIPNQSSVPSAYKQFDDNGRMKPSPLYDRVVDVAEELMKFTLLTKGKTDYLVSRYSERCQAGEESEKN